MANYKESKIGGTSWVRSNDINIRNELGGIPSILFKEEMVYTIGKDTIKCPYQTPTSPGGVVAKFTNPAEAFNLVDPDTNEVVGSAKLGDFRIILHSLYLYLAKKRDDLDSKS